MTFPPVLQRVTAMLTAYESRSIDAAELHGRLLKALHVSGSTDARLTELLSGVDEATDLGQNEREVVAWAAARFWRRTAEGT